jgi:hypothetical protein
MPPKFLQQRREDVQAHGHAAYQAQRSRQFFLRVEDAFRRVLDVRKDAMAQLKQRLAGRSDLNAPAEANE